MVTRLVVRNRERALADAAICVRLARLLGPTPLSIHADRDLARARRRLRRADLLLDLWTLRNRARECDHIFARCTCGSCDIERCHLCGASTGTAS